MEENPADSSEDNKEDSDDVEGMEDGQARAKHRRVVALPSPKCRGSGKQLPIYEDMKNVAHCRFQGCSRKTHIKCKDCDVFLCVAKENNCFLKFHINKKQLTKFYCPPWWTNKI